MVTVTVAEPDDPLHPQPASTGLAVNNTSDSGTTNPKTNLARCFRCEQNFNPIDLTMLERQYDFREAVAFLAEFLDNMPAARNAAGSALPSAPAHSNRDP